MRCRVQQIFVGCARAISASETHARDLPILNLKLGLLFYKIQLVLILKSNKVVVKKALVYLYKRLKRLPNNIKIIKKEHKIILIACISCC
jgi:hypothetical protein